MSYFQHSLYRDPANDNLYTRMDYNDEVHELNRLVGMNIHDILYRLRNGWKFIPQGVKIMSDYDAWLSIKMAEPRYSYYKEGIVSYTKTSWCYNCNCITQTYFTNDGRYVRSYCNVCGHRKWNEE